MSTQEFIPQYKEPLGNVLVIGGCGFLGHHVTKYFLNDPTSTAVAVVSRRPVSNTFPGVDYHTGDVRDKARMEEIIKDFKPKVIINTASPVAYFDHEHAGDYHTVSVDGNANLLAIAKATPSVEAYVYTSSAPIIAGTGSSYHRADETAQTLNVTRKGDPYHVAKAIADQMVLDANDRNGIRTATIRPTAMYGEGDWQMTRDVIDTWARGENNVYMGDNKNLMDMVYVKHVAKAHLLAARALLDGAKDPSLPKVDGEAFNITDDTPMQPWTFFRKFWAECGDRTPIESVFMIPAWLALIMAQIAEFFVWATSGGKRRPFSLNHEKIEFAVFTRTYNIEKAKERLQYRPDIDMKEAVHRAVQWELKDRQRRAAEGQKVPQPKSQKVHVA